MNEEREKLFIKIFDIYKVNKTHHQCIEAIVDYILADRKRICEPLVKLKGVTPPEMALSIYQTLKRAGLEE